MYKGPETIVLCVVHPRRGQGGHVTSNQYQSQCDRVKFKVKKKKKKSCKSLSNIQYGNNNDSNMTAGNGKEIINIPIYLYLYIIIYYIISYFLRGFA